MTSSENPKSQKTTTPIRIPPRLVPLLRTIGRIAAEKELPAYAVGGCVRDWMLGSDTVDLDVTVDGSGIDIARAAAEALDASLEIHQHFGTATLHMPSAQVVAAMKGTRQPVPSIDFATCRKERYPKPGAYPEVALGSLRQDLYRRDFTINAMAVTLSPRRFGELVDPFGGAADLKRKQLRILHDRSFLDDPSRILRGIRLVHHFGLTWETRTRRALKEAMDSGSLALLNAGRIRKELGRMGEESDAKSCFKKLITMLEASLR